MKRIVVATDMSERSDRAVERALKLSSDINASCTVLAIVDGSLPEDMASDLKESKQLKLRRLLDARKGAQAEIDVRIGDVVPGVLGVAAELDADILVLGLHRKRDFMDSIRETTMERIVSMSRHPVLLVRDAVDGSYQKVLVAVNFSTACAAAVSAAHRIAPGAEIHKIHALHVPFAGLTGGSQSGMANAVRREAGELAQIWKKTNGVPSELPAIVTGTIHQVLGEKLRSFKPDLLAIGAHNRGGLGFHRLGSFAAELMRDPPADLLVART